MIICIAIAISIIEGISMMSKNGCDDKELLDYISENTTKLSVNLMEMSIRNPSTIIISALTATWK